jgi:8-oxo-dGTP diphosphatase
MFGESACAVWSWRRAYLSRFASSVGGPAAVIPLVPSSRRPMARRARVRAAGGVIVRRTNGGEPELLLIHRPRQNDWTFPKGKVESGESDEACALREVEEETGLRCEFESESELPPTAHITNKGRLKEVRYWLMRPVGGEAAPHNEVDAVRWVPLARVAKILTYQRDRDLLRSLRAGGRA